MPLDPDVKAMLQQMQARGLPPMSAGTPEQGRALLRAFSGVDRRDPAELPPVAEVTEASFGGVRARVYRARTDGPAPTVVFLHGGGFVIGDLDTHDLAVRLLARSLGAVVVSVDYALAPERPFPAAVDDAWSAFRDVVDRVDELGGDAGRVVVAGDSAGANLAAVTAIRARDEGIPLAAQLLAYPAVDPGGEYASRTENADGYFLTARDMAWFIEQYLGVGADSPEARERARDWRIAPLLAPTLAGVASAVVATAEFDPLRDEGVAYAAALEAAGVRVWHRTFPGMIHGFYGTPLPGPLAATREIDAALAALLG
ncbi:alpha/beta hydrolase [Amnibacterium endophyticum]|uniref:Alpha/beta hydrolase n=1 Tax=Amnibacterium endophyticum TaxID=2109337 RepID=A0ABW4LBG7_9MICO